MLKTIRMRSKHDGAFTLVEILVVMLILGVLAAIAIPIFLNQQKTARDSATTSDVKNLALNVDDALITIPDASYMSLAAGTGKVTLRVGTTASTAMATTVTMTKGTRVALVNNNDGSYKIYAYNPKGKSYKDMSSVLVYDAVEGGLVNTQPKSVTTARVNLVNDPSFEGGINWSPYFSTPSSRVADAKVGSYALQYTTVSATQANGGWHVITRDWVAGETLNVSAWVKMPAGVKYSLGLRSISQPGIGAGAKLYTGTGDWQQVAISYVIPATPEPWYAPQIITNSPFPPVGTKFQIDGVMAEVSETPGSYIEGPVAGDVASSAWVTVS